MLDKMIENNQVSIVGEVISPFTFSHEVFGEGFYMTDIAVSRLSDSEDLIPVMVSERLVDVTEDIIGSFVRVSGQFRSYNRHEEDKTKLVLSVFAREWGFIEEEVENAKTNQIFLDGFICKPPVYRKTPLGREIADLLIAVNRPYGKSDYIPCICWGRNARFASGFEVGGRTQVWGRIQSREYIKKLDDGALEVRTAYEVSVYKINADDKKSGKFRIGETVRVIGTTDRGDGVEEECIKIGTVCKVVGFEEYEGSGLIVGVVPEKDFGRSTRNEYWYSEKDVEKGRMEWMPEREENIDECKN